jgi:hypothetical protein
MRRTLFFRVCFALVFGGLLSVLYWRTSGSLALQAASRGNPAAPRGNPNVLWEIGAVDNSGDEFS